HRRRAVPPRRAEPERRGRPRHGPARRPPCRPAGPGRRRGRRRRGPLHTDLAERRRSRRSGAPGGRGHLGRRSRRSGKRGISVRAPGSARRSVRGVTLIELVVGMGITLLVLGACVGAIAASTRLVATLGARAEAEDTAQLAVEAFRFDVRRAGFDPTASGVEGLAGALPDQPTLQADLDADGTLDAGSEELTRWVCATAP